MTGFNCILVFSLVTSPRDVQPETFTIFRRCKPGCPPLPRGGNDSRRSRSRCKLPAAHKVVVTRWFHQLRSRLSHSPDGSLFRAWDTFLHTRCKECWTPTADNGRG